MTYYDITRPKARKLHRCMLCWRTIRPGEKYVRGAGMDGSAAWTWKECAHCDTIRDLARAEWADDEYGDDLIGEWEPCTTGQARLKAMWRRKWTRDDGSLFPVPEKVFREDRYGFGWQVDARAAS